MSADESMAPSCLISTVKVAAGGVIVWGIVLYLTEEPLSTTTYSHIVGDV